jgi:hypothetical protein
MAGGGFGRRTQKGSRVVADGFLPSANAIA